MAEDITGQADVQKMAQQFQMLQQQLQNILLQKESLRIQDLEIDSALKELGATKEKNAFKITGSIMISKPVAEIKKDLDSAKEAIGLRLTSLEKNEKKTSEMLLELQEKLKKFIG